MMQSAYYMSQLVETLSYDLCLVCRFVETANSHDFRKILQLNTKKYHLIF